MISYRLVLQEDERGDIYIYKDVEMPVLPRVGENVDVPDLDHLPVISVLHRYDKKVVEVYCSVGSLSNLQLTFQDGGWNMHDSTEPETLQILQEKV